MVCLKLATAPEVFMDFSLITSLLFVCGQCPVDFCHLNQSMIKSHKLLADIIFLGSETAHELTSSKYCLPQRILYICFPVFATEIHVDETSSLVAC